ncbi:MAG: hypothetical protein O3B84_03720 [Chloroflexi bacterium]|nr:hypothetical protein [Chloroflexota bacterium]
MKTTMLSIAIVLLIGLSSATPVVGVTQDDESLSLKGCLLLSRRAGIYALHMEYNRVAVTGHADLANHVGHLVVLTGAFETPGGYLQFVAEEITHVAPSCEAQASVTVPMVNHA